MLFRVNFVNNCFDDLTLLSKWTVEMHEPTRGGNQHCDSNKRIAFVTEPISNCAAEGRRKVTQRWIGKARRLYRSLQESQRDPRKQQDTNPVKSSFHERSPKPWVLERGLKAVALSFCALVLLPSCSEGELKGQVIAEIDCQEVTLRELQEAIRLQKSANGDEPDKQAALDALLRQKILVAEALERGLNKKESVHFAMRQMREQLLVAALEREILFESREVTDDQIDLFISQNSWRFEERFTAELSRDEQIIKVDSFDFISRPEWIQNAPSAGAVVTIEGLDWSVDEILTSPLTGEQARNLARNTIMIEGQAKQLEQIIANHRLSGQIRYQSGYGPAQRFED